MAMDLAGTLPGVRLPDRHSRPDAKQRCRVEYRNTIVDEQRFFCVKRELTLQCRPKCRLLFRKTQIVRRNEMLEKNIKTRYGSLD